MDSNVLIYAYDSEAGTKHRIANSILRELWEQRVGVLSVQVLQEFYVNVTRKIPKPIPRNKARLFVESFTSWCSETTTAEISTAFRIEDEARISFWDALIVAAAIKHGASRILSEDLNAGERIAGIVIENPFVLQ
ncbi:MAG: PIN domain-containing protein [Terriglobales bacterium]